MNDFLCEQSDIIYWHDLRKNPDDLPELKGNYSETVILWTSGRKVLTAIYDGTDFWCDAEYWESVGEDVIAWYYAPVFLEDE